MMFFGFGAMMVGLGVGFVAPSPFSAFATLWIVWLVGYVSFGMAPRISAIMLVTLPAVATVFAEAILAQAGYNSASLSGAREGTVIAFAFAVASIWRGWTTVSVLKWFRRGFNALFERIGRGSYALYLLHYPLLLALQTMLIKYDGGALLWFLTSALLAFFVMFFCPWVERISIMPFRNLNTLKTRMADEGRSSSAVGIE
jgi:peptidoglycan/LPS O-acetylase OafA/YrhL